MPPSRPPLVSGTQSRRLIAVVFEHRRLHLAFDAVLVGACPVSLVVRDRETGIETALDLAEPMEPLGRRNGGSDCRDVVSGGLRRQVGHDLGVDLLAPLVGLSEDRRQIGG